VSKSAVIILADGFEEIEAVTPVDVLRRAQVEVALAGVGGISIRGAHGLTFPCDLLIEAIHDAPDAVILPGGLPGAENLGKSDHVRQLVCQVHDNGGVCAAICAAPALTFAKYGLLDGRTATCYPSFENEFTKSTIPSEARVVVDGNIVTSRGPGTALEFSLELVRRLVDSSTADGLREAMLARC